MRDRDAWLCFEDESGQGLRPPEARTWSCRGVTPVVRVKGSGSGRVCLAGMICTRPGRRIRLICRTIVHHGRTGERKGFREDGFARLLDTAHQQLGGNIVLVWDNSRRHTDARMRRPLEGRAGWLTVFRLPPYAPGLNPAEGVWSHLERTLANMAACSIDTLTELARTRLKKMQYSPALLDGFITETGLTLTTP